MALTLKVAPARSCTGGHLQIEVTATLPNGSTRQRAYGTDRIAMQEPITDDEIEATARVLMRLMVTQLSNKSAANIAAVLSAKTIDLTVA